MAGLDRFRAGVLHRRIRLAGSWHSRIWLVESEQRRSRLVGFGHLRSGPFWRQSIASARRSVGPRVAGVGRLIVPGQHPHDGRHIACWGWLIALSTRQRRIVGHGPFLRQRTPPHPLGTRHRPFRYRRIAPGNQPLSTRRRPLRHRRTSPGHRPLGIRHRCRLPRRQRTESSDRLLGTRQRHRPVRRTPPSHRLRRRRLNTRHRHRLLWRQRTPARPLRHGRTPPPLNTRRRHRPLWRHRSVPRLHRSLRPPSRPLSVSRRHGSVGCRRTLRDTGCRQRVNGWGPVRRRSADQPCHTGSGGWGVRLVGRFGVDGGGRCDWVGRGGRLLDLGEILIGCRRFLDRAGRVVVGRRWLGARDPTAAAFGQGQAADRLGDGRWGGRGAMGWCRRAACRRENGLEISDGVAGDPVLIGRCRRPERVERCCLGHLVRLRPTDIHRLRHVVRPAGVRQRVERCRLRSRMRLRPTDARRQVERRVLGNLLQPTRVRRLVERCRLGRAVDHPDRPWSRSVRRRRRLSGEQVAQ